MTATTFEPQLNGTFPLTYDEFIGQDQAKQQLRAAVASAKSRGTRLPHILLSAEAGVGKTSMAQLVAEDMQKPMVVVTGQMDTNQVRMILAEMLDGDILFIDEIHTIVQGGKGKAAWALHLLENGSLMGPYGMEQQSDITIIGATTDAGRLGGTILDRFPIKPVFVPYTDDEATQIATTIAFKVWDATVKVPMPGALNCEDIARVGDHNPRVIRGLLENLRDSAVANGAAHYDHELGEYNLSEILRWNGLTEDGLTDEAVRYMLALKKNFQGGAGSAALKEALNAPGGLERTEHLLSRKGYIARTKAGRVLTQSGIKRTIQLERDKEAAK